MSQKTSNVIKTLQEKLSPEDYEALLETIHNEPNELIIQMTEKPTEKTDMFIEDLSTTLSVVKSNSDEFGSGIRTMAYSWSHFQRLLRMLSGMKLNEIKFVMSYVTKLDEVLKMSDGEAIFNLLTFGLFDGIREHEYESISRDVRFRDFF